MFSFRNVFSFMSIRQNKIRLDVKQCRNYDVLSVSQNLIRGLDHLRDPRLNKCLAFTLEERQALGIQGLLAPLYKTQEEQLNVCRVSLDQYKNDLNKYLYLAELLDTNEKLFFSLISQNIETFLPIVYTPTVGLACQKFGLVYKRPRGLFITINDRGQISRVIRNWPEQDVRAIVFTDGERILGLGDLGAYGMGIPVGKLALYTALAGIKPHQCLPVTLDVGTDNATLLEDPLYIGLRQKRVRGKDYDDFVQEFMEACVKRFGANILLQFEDFALANATRLLQKYRNDFCTFNDDIQGTASVAVAGLLATGRITKKKLTEYTYMFLGAGSAATGIANLTCEAMVEDGMQLKDAQNRIYLFDINGLLSSKRESGLPEHCKHFAKDVEPEKNFEACVAKYKPTCLIGMGAVACFPHLDTRGRSYVRKLIENNIKNVVCKVGCSTVKGAFNEKILKLMAQNTERPVIFALSNPTSRAECSAQEAYDHTDGKCIFASGSPFPPVKFKDKQYITGQGNNSYIFPGLALGVIAVRARIIPESMFLRAARSLANFVSEEDLNLGRIYPPLSDIKKISYVMAADLAALAYEKGIATVHPPPKDFKKFLDGHIYNLSYHSCLPNFFKYPKPPDIKVKSVEEVHGVPKMGGKKN